MVCSKSTELVRQALRRGASLVGGVDPATVDGDIEASLQEMVGLAVEANAGIDLHLHDAHHLGTFTMKRLAQLTIEAGLQGKVAISHAFGLGDIPLSQAQEMGTCSLMRGRHYYECAHWPEISAGWFVATSAV